MPDVAEQGLRLQLGLEVTPNVPVAATKRIRSFGLNFDPQLETDQFFPDGNFVPSGSSLIQEWTEGEVTGVLTYTESIYAMLMAFGDPTTAVAAPTIGADTSLLARDWLWAPQAQALLTPRTATVERGSTVYGTRVAAGVLTGLSFEWTRTDRIELKGAFMGTSIIKPHVMTVIAANATVPLHRVLPTQIDVFIDDTYTAIDGLTPTKMLRTFQGNFSIENLYGGIWAVNSAFPSYDGIVPKQPDTEAGMMFMANADGLQFLDTARAGQTKYMKMRATGPIIDVVGATTFRHLFELTMPIEIKDVDAFEGNEGVYAIPWTFQPIDDGVNPPIKIRMRNTLLAA
jgi:hypothetical protein